MKLIRKVVFWLHLTAGVLAGIFIFVMCVTGALQIGALTADNRR